MTVLPHSRKKCQAQDPSTCRYHGNPVSAGALELYNKFLAKQTVAPFADDKLSATEKAITSSLNWQGNPPAWFKKYADKASGKEVLSTNPEILEVIDSPLGKLAVVWEETSQFDEDVNNSLDSGYTVQTLQYRSFKTGEKLGFIKLSSMTDESFERSFGNDEFTEFRYAQRYHGVNYKFKEGQEGTNRYILGSRNLEGNDLLAKRRQIWLAAQSDTQLNNALTTSSTRVVGNNGFNIPSYEVNEKHIPSDEKVTEDLKVFRETLRKSVNNKRAYFSAPYIDYSTINESLKGKGFGTAMYVFAARKLATQGKFLRGSGIQSAAAKAVWERFNKLFPNNVGSLTNNLDGKNFVNPTLDFRESVKTPV